MVKGREFDLQDRLVDYAVRIIKVCEALPNNKLELLQQETTELISILFQSIETAKKNAQ
jgi:hypothetical protein